MIIIAWVLLLAILLLGFIVSSKKKHDHLVFFKALLLLVIMIVVNTVFFAGIFILYLKFADQLSFEKLTVQSLFSIVLLLIIISGVVLYWFLRILMALFKFSVTTLTIVEYYIQWSLIYVTVYQVVFDKFLNRDEIRSILHGNLFDPTLIVMLILPSFISAWMAVILYKVHDADI